MKIALVSPYDFSTPGGVVKHIYYLDKYLREMGNEVKIIAPCSQEDEPLPDHLIKASSIVIGVPLAGSVARISISPLVYRRVKKILEKEQFDIVHIHEPMTPILPLAALRHSKAINVATFHAYRPDSHPIYEYSEPIFKRLGRKLDGRIAVSRAARDHISRYFPGEYRIIPNGVDVEMFGKPTLPVERFADGRPNVLFVGRLEKRKGLRHLLDAFKYVKQTIPDARLLVVGAFDEDDKKPFVEYVRENRIYGVRFVGKVPEEELPRYYHTCDVFCAPSIGFESFGMVLLEAMAAGKPVVASDIPGYSDVLKSGAEGILVPPANPEALARAIVYLLNNPSLRAYMGEMGRKKAACYSWHNVASQVFEFYQELQGRRKLMLKFTLYQRDLRRKPRDRRMA